MKLFDFKKSILAAAAIAISLTASAQHKTDVVENNNNSTDSEIATTNPEREAQSESADTIVLSNDYQADGAGFKFSHAIDWDKQYVKAVVDLSTCQRSVEDVFSLGATAFDWYNNIHVRYTQGKLVAFWDGKDGNGDNNTGEISVKDQVTIVVNKADGLVVDGVVKIAANRMSGLYGLTNISVGSGEGQNQQTYAFYKTIAILPVESGPSGIETLTVNNNAKTDLNVYGINGQLLKSGTTDLNGLPHGIYVVNGKKVMK